jgi:hypothetical protein
VSGAGVSAGSGVVSPSNPIHSTANRGQRGLYCSEANQTIWLSVPHGTPPAGVRTTGLATDGSGTLTDNGLNRFLRVSKCETGSHQYLPDMIVERWGAERNVLQGTYSPPENHPVSTIMRADVLNPTLCLQAVPVHEWDVDRGELEKSLFCRRIFIVFFVLLSNDSR